METKFYCDYLFQVSYQVAVFTFAVVNIIQNKLY